MEYNGFSIAEMLLVLRRDSRRFRLENIDGTDNRWRLYILSETYGEFEAEGELLQLMSQAFRPYMNGEVLKRKELILELEKTRSSLLSELDNRPIFNCAAIYDRESKAQHYIRNSEDLHCQSDVVPSTNPEADHDEI